MLEPYPKDDRIADNWDAMGHGAPTLMALAKLCAEAIGRAEPPTPEQLQQLPEEAKAILFAARTRGVIEVKGVNTAFEAPSRFLAIYVDPDEERSLVFRSRSEPKITIRFFDAFRELCQLGLVMHHLYHDFSLTTIGFEYAETLTEDEVAEAMQHATEFGLH